MTKSKWFIYSFIVLFSFISLFAQERNNKRNNKRNKLPKLPTSLLYKKVRLLWLNQDSRSLKNVLADRVTLNLGEFRGVCSKEQAVGILGTYFKKVKVMQFKYQPKKMEMTRASAFYQYQIKATGEVKRQRLYLSVFRERNKRKKKGRWKIRSIRVFGNNKRTKS